MSTHPDLLTNINAQLVNVVKSVADTFNRLYDAALLEKLSKVTQKIAKEYQ
ncbi:hypothetical protein HMJ29_05700 [Hymenobacter taeanensis]|uniref:Uncharacterized protein n=2 Tax=Hymenobacter TaxID=89966 RepID=A0A6M6BHD8_9BACT|nr:hypothetical protein [Hymenobacter taeanensis]QJX46455.1 hypothetical protein HMJ29_05700 [Hymenobacter taeanensis]